MRSAEELQRAQRLVGAARDFLSSHGEGGQAPALIPGFEFHSGCLYVVEWVLEEPGSEIFSDHLDKLERLRKEMLQGVTP